ncbi:unnamed protein product [Trifolium pratense]|uniref:Uncharacterized protein n=1 Tax=Trifolium pratense TaxID=57577 RepID=A0ACB0KY80_TRIPR|nr:unnamed protein product [Trifolium pratense]
MDAISASPYKSMKRYVILIKRGVYMENIVIDESKWNLMIIGEGIDTTIISGNLNCATFKCGQNNNLSTYDTATFAVSGKRFIAKEISFRNTAGPTNGQAVALKSDSDFSVFYRCEISGYQDSLCANTNLQFYKECIMSGTVDFIFGYATAVFQNCTILVKKGLPVQKNTITAQGGKYQGRPTGFSFQFCNISADSDLLPAIKSTSTFLGRPWHPYSKVIFMQTYISDVLNQGGWLEWNGSQYLDTLYYAEYNNFGPGADLRNRVKWSGYHMLNDSSQARIFTVAQFISGDQWLPSTGVPFISGLGDQNII